MLLNSGKSLSAESSLFCCAVLAFPRKAVHAAFQPVPEPAAGPSWAAYPANRPRYFPAGSMPATASGPSSAAFGGTPTPDSMAGFPLMGAELSPGVWLEASFPPLACHNRALRESSIKNSSLSFPLPSDLMLQQGKKVLYHSIPRRDFQEKNLCSGTIPQACLQRHE